MISSYFNVEVKSRGSNKENDFRTIQNINTNNSSSIQSSAQLWNLAKTPSGVPNSSSRNTCLLDSLSTYGVNYDAMGKARSKPMTDPRNSFRFHSYSKRNITPTLLVPDEQNSKFPYMSNKSMVPSAPKKSFCNNSKNCRSLITQIVTVGLARLGSSRNISSLLDLNHSGVRKILDKIQFVNRSNNSVVKNNQMHSLYKKRKGRLTSYRGQNTNKVLRGGKHPVPFVELNYL